MARVQVTRPEYNEAKISRKGKEWDSKFMKEEDDRRKTRMEDE